MKTYTTGAMADSYYEYLLKMWLLKQQKVPYKLVLLTVRSTSSTCHCSFYTMCYTVPCALPAVNALAEGVLYCLAPD